MAQLFVLSGADVGRSFEVKGGDTIGRSQDCILVLKDASISRRHAHLEERDGVWCIVDDGSRNRISIGAVRHLRAELPDGQEFLLGEVLMRFRNPAPARPGPAPVSPVAPTEIRAPAAAVRAEAVRAAPATQAEPDGGIVLEGADEIDLRFPARPAQAPSQLARTYLNPSVAPPAPMPRDAAAIGLGPPSRERLAEQRGRVLQYHRVADSGSPLSFELAQLPLWARWGLYLLSLLLLAGAFWLAFFGSAFVKTRVGGGEPVEVDAQRDPGG